MQNNNLDLSKLSEEQIKRIAEIANNAANNVQIPKIEETLTVTSLTDLEKYAKGQIVRLPDFSEGQPFVARVRRPSILVLAKSGKIPNSLLNTANELFSKGGNGLDSDNSNMLKDVSDVMEIICEAALVEPTYEQIKEKGMELTDEQKMALFSYSQQGVKALSNFR